jgi:hypothetical protein
VAQATAVEEQDHLCLEQEVGRPRFDLWVMASLAVVGAVVVAVAFFRLESTARGLVDDQTLKAWAVRTHELGVSTYTGSGNQRGPLWVAFYLAALHVTDGVGYWFVIAGILVAMAAVTAGAIAVIVRDVTGSRSAAAATAVATFAYLVLGPEEFSQGLLSRNISAMFTALSFAALWRALPSVPRRRGLLLLAVSGASLGLAVQTMPTTAFPAAVFGLTVFAWGALILRTRRDVLVGAASWGGALIAGFATAPIYYWLRGDFSNFWNLYWGYNKIYAGATAAPLGTQLRTAADTFGRYYAQHGVFVAVIVAFLALSAVSWRGNDGQRRLFELTLVGWWLAEVGSVIAGQRYFGHHFILPFVPMAVMGGIVLAFALRHARAALRRSVPVLAALTVCLGAGNGGFRVGLHQATAFNGLSRYGEWHFLALPPDRRAQRALAEAITTRRDHLQAWSHWTGFYDELDRPPATRYNALTWFIGYVYGRPEPDTRFILPGTFERWHEDMRRTPPRLFLVAVGIFKISVPEPAGEVRAFLDRGYTPLFGNFEGTMYVDNGLASSLRDLMARTGGVPALLQPGAAPPSVLGVLEVDGGARTAPAEFSLSSPGSCYVLNATFERPDGPGGTLSVSFPGNGKDDPRVSVAVGRDRVRSVRLVEGQPAIEADSPAPASAGRAHRLQLLVVRKSALVFVDGHLVGMMRTTATSPRLTFASSEDRVALREVTVHGLQPQEWAPCGG